MCPSERVFTFEVPFKRLFAFLSILGPPYCGIGAIIRIDREMLCLPYALWAELVIESRCLSVCLMSPFHVIFSRPLIGPQIT